MKSGIVTQADEQPRAFIRWRRWVPLCVLVSLLLGIRWIDSNLKRSDSNGLVSPDAAWSLSVDDVGTAWDSVLATDTWEALSKRVGDPTRESLIEARKSLGIRVSPRRWNAWFGPKAVFSSVDGTIGASARPGVLFRLVHYGLRLFGNAPVDGIYTYSEFNYVWRDGFVCFSKEREFLVHMGSMEVVPIASNGDLRAVTVELTSPYPLRCVVRLENGFPVEGEIEYPATAAKPNLSLTSKTSGDDALTIASARPQDWFPLLDALIPDWPNLDLAHDMLEGTDAQIGQQRTSGDIEMVWVLDAIAGDEFLAVPIFTLAGSGGLSASIPNQHSPYLLTNRWGTLDGWKEPWFGHTYEWCVASKGDLVVITNQTWNMRRNDDRWLSTSPTKVDCRITLNYSVFARLIKPVVIQAAELEYIPGTNMGDVEGLWANRWDIVASLGVLELGGTAENNLVVFSGFLDGAIHE